MYVTHKKKGLKLIYSVLTQPAGMMVKYIPLSSEDFYVFLTPLKSNRKSRGGGIHDINLFYSMLIPEEEVEF